MCLTWIKSKSFLSVDLQRVLFVSFLFQLDEKYQFKHRKALSHICPQGNPGVRWSNIPVSGVHQCNRESVFSHLGFLFPYYTHSGNSIRLHVRQMGKEEYTAYWLNSCLYRNTYLGCFIRLYAIHGWCIFLG